MQQISAEGQMCVHGMRPLVLTATDVSTHTPPPHHPSPDPHPPPPHLFTVYCVHAGDASPGISLISAHAEAKPAQQGD